MTTNLLKALLVLVERENFVVQTYRNLENRMNSQGESLEYFVKDAFCNSFGIRGTVRKHKEYTKHLSYIGNSNNPPDFMVRGGDACEVKKVKGLRGGINLNSSYPKDKLYRDNPQIQESCRQCEKWNVKDLIYAVGVVTGDSLKALLFVYGDCYAADKKIYESARERVISGVKGADIELSETRELGRANKVDPLGITTLRVRGMWQIESPFKVFREVGIGESENRVAAIMKREKYSSFPTHDRKALERLGAVRDSEVIDPNNPARLLRVKVVEF